MHETLRGLQQRHNLLMKKAEKLHAARAESGRWTGEDQRQFDHYMSETADLREQITAREARIEQLKRGSAFIESGPPDAFASPPSFRDEIRDGRVLAEDESLFELRHRQGGRIRPTSVSKG
jgi:hypothetical protein